MKVGVLMGGISSERYVSMCSGKEIADNLDKSKYEVVPIIIDSPEELIDKAKNIDFAFLGFHGRFGEDGTCQAVLEALNIPYSGCGVLSSSICMDKNITKKVLRGSGIKTPDWIMIRDMTEIDYNYLNKSGYPFIIKPNKGGSSIGVSIAENDEELRKSVSLAFEEDDEIIIEKYLDGDEITCCMLDGRLLPIISIKSHAAFFDYKSKYSDEGAEEKIVKLDKNIYKKVEEISIKSFRELDCKVYSRIDIIINGGEPNVLEINTLPGLTKSSLFPLSASSCGLNLSELLNHIIEYSIRKTKPA